MGEGVERLGGREAQSAMMRCSLWFTSGGQGVRGVLQSPVSKPQPFFLPETPTALAHTSPVPRGPGWEAGDSGYGPRLTSAKLGVGVG